jgi:hypothetical protein
MATLMIGGEEDSGTVGSLSAGSSSDDSFFVVSFVIVGTFLVVVLGLMVGGLVLLCFVTWSLLVTPLAFLGNGSSLAMGGSFLGSGLFVALVTRLGSSVVTFGFFFESSCVVVTYALHVSET